MSKSAIITIIISSGISLVIGIFIGEPIKYFINSLILRKSIKRDNLKLFKELNKLMPELIKEMKNDLLQYPLRREFVLLSKNCCYNGESLAYYYEEHDDLEDKMKVLENNGLIENITYNNTHRYRITEAFTKHLVK